VACRFFVAGRIGVGGIDSVENPNIHPTDDTSRNLGRFQILTVSTIGKLNQVRKNFSQGKNSHSLLPSSEIEENDELFVMNGVLVGMKREN
jgi:hypothetical protein